MTDSHTLSERYLHAAAGYLPEAQRADFRRELAERIQDTVDAKREAGASESDAEYATLSELGDPGRLAAAYQDRPLQLIGPRYYLLWRYLLRLLLPIVIIATAFGVTLGNVLSGEPVANVVTAAISTALSVAVWLCFWVTAVFALLERLPAGSKVERDVTRRARWRPEQLPVITGGAERETRRDMIAEAVWLAILAVFVLVVQQLSFVRGAGGEHVRFFLPETWAWMKWALIAILVLELGVTVALLVRGRWQWRHATAKLVLEAAFCAVVLPPLLTGLLINPDFFTTAGWTTGPEMLGPGGMLTTFLALGTVIACAGNAFVAFRKAYRDERGAVGLVRPVAA